MDVISMLQVWCHHQHYVDDVFVWVAALSCYDRDLMKVAW